MLKIDDNLLQQIGLGALPAEEKRNLLAHIYETLEMRVGMRLADQMTNEQLDEFEMYFEAKDDAGAFKWLESNFPNYKDIVNDEFEKLKVEVQQSAPQILAAAQANPAAGQQLPPAQSAALPPQQPYADPYAQSQAAPVQPQPQQAWTPPAPTDQPQQPLYQPPSPAAQPAADPYQPAPAAFQPPDAPAPAQPYAAPPQPGPGAQPDPFAQTLPQQDQSQSWMPPAQPAADPYAQAPATQPQPWSPPAQDDQQGQNPSQPPQAV